MTLSPAAGPAHHGVPDLPGPGTSVLIDRPLAPGTTADSVFGDDRWNLTPALFEAHATAVSVNFLAVAPPLRIGVKHYLWQLLNHDAPVRLRHARGARPSVRTAAAGFHRIASFSSWLVSAGIETFADVTAEDLDRYLGFVNDAETARETKEDLLHEVLRLWSYRDRLPYDARLPAPPPWDGDDLADLLPRGRRSTGNRTARITTPVIETLLMWSLRFVEDFAPDVIAAAAEERRLWASGGTSRGKAGAPRRPYASGQAEPALRSYLAGLATDGGSLPGRRTRDGTVEVNWSHLTRLLGTAANYFGAGGKPRRIVQAAGLPVSDRTVLDVPVRGHVGQQPWQPDGIAYDEAPRLSRLLSTACFIVIAYLSGARPGEVLTLERGCITHDRTAHVWLMNGRRWKGATDPDGRKRPDGEQRHDPWTVIEPVAHAVSALEQLHRHRLLFPVQIDQRRHIGGSGARRRPGEALTSSMVAKDITEFTAWVNAYCDTYGFGERIPDDPAGTISPSRFRRTLAWHIVRRPRGLIACAIQYSHVNVAVTLGYGGTYDSGFPDARAYEDWLFRLEQLADDEQRLTEGERVSGPAADVYRHRVHAANARFAGRVLTTTRQARDLLTNTDLQIYPGRAMTCVFDPAKAACRLIPSQDDITRTPDQDDCRPRCTNIAFTDRDIARQKVRAAELQTVVDDPLAPSIRKQRDRHELARLRKIINGHARTE